MITTKINTNYIKNMAYTFILKENITSLPINALAILRRRKYYLRPYEQFHVFNATPEQIICVFGNAFVYPTRSATTPYGLGINMKCSFLERNWSVMHELGHIELGHVTHLMSASGSYDDVVIWAEREVELFCMYVMCPDVILQELNICSLEDIQRTCLIPRRKAEEKLDYFKGLEYKLKSFAPATPLEKNIRYNFRKYIDDYNSKQSCSWEFSAELSF
ncbi:hypothetical protein [Enterocloster lavalensis]|uniref:hypothetical protein n=1 Tax=Enterocloster lavalensis TaxID=460384 RepID=UPI001D08626E|nr:hypothetical protein [Enterocloster lavalensis]MCB6343725.1 hypothetical protein [Enterocloster lavalensis]